MLPAKSRFASVKAYVLATLHALQTLQWDDVSLTRLTEMVFRAFEECSDAETPERYNEFRGSSWKFKRTKAYDRATDPEMTYAKEHLRKKFVEDDFLKNTL